MATQVALRWTIGDVSEQGFEALRLAVWGAWRVFGDRASYAICVNSLPVEVAEWRAGQLPAACTWRAVTLDLPPMLRAHLDDAMAEGVAWKFAPLRLFPDRHELSLDNDCVLWSMPPAIERWLADDRGACLLAEDVRACFGQFADECGDEPRNAGVRGFPPGFDLAGALDAVLRARPVKLASELDEQGLQVAALSRSGRPFVVSLDDVSICSPFPPHLPHLGRCGAHFCGLNARDLGWELDGRPASELVRDHWARHRPELHARVGLELIA